MGEKEIENFEGELRARSFNAFLRHCRWTKRMAGRKMTCSGSVYVWPANEMGVVLIRPPSGRHDASFLSMTGFT
jgi:hypothetical protein